MYCIKYFIINLIYNTYKLTRISSYIVCTERVHRNRFELENRYIVTTAEQQQRCTIQYKIYTESSKKEENKFERQKNVVEIYGELYSFFYALWCLFLLFFWCILSWNECEIKVGNKLMWMWCLGVYVSGYDMDRGRG